MNRRLLLQVTAPAVLIGLLLFVGCLVSAWHVNRLQTNLTSILSQNVSSLRAAEQMEISVRRLRFHCFLYLLAPDPSVLQQIQEDHGLFETWLDRADQTGLTPAERTYVEAIRTGYDRYRSEFEGLRQEVEHAGPRRDVRELADAHPLRHVLDPCQEYLQVNETLMNETSRESGALSRRLRLTMVLLGLGGPLGGLVGGFGIARGLSRSLYRLSVRVQDVAQQLDQDVAAVRLTPDGDLRSLDLQLQHVVSRVAEVTERLQRQHRQILRAQQLAAVGQLAASVAHEVRNPLMSIKLLVESGLRNHKPKPFTLDNLRVIHGEILRLEQTVQNFLDFARPPALQRAPCDLREVVARAVELVRARARQQQVAVEVRAPERPVSAEVDRGQLCGVLVNLFMNALDAMPGGGRLEVELAAAKGVRLTVTDTGTGISPEMADQLFAPFASSKPTGSGLGLSICRRIVEEHGGRITAANRPEGGARFTISVPETPAGENHAQPAGH